jgi:TatD DNase family protein
LHERIGSVVGIHPHHAAEAVAADVAALEALQSQEGVLGMGEMGLDYHYDFSPRERQREVFLWQLEVARRQGRPVVIHCREATEDCLGILRDFGGVAALFHCFTGSMGEAKRILDAGYLLGFTGVLTFKRSEELREVARMAPADRIVVETDSPYLAPEPFRRQKVNEPALVVYTAAVLARVRGVRVEEIERVTTENVRRFFGWG